MCKQSINGEKSLVGLVDIPKSTNLSHHCTMPKEKQPKKKGPSLRHAPLGVEVEKKQKIPVSSIREQDDDIEDSADVVDDSNLPQNLGAQIFNQAREQRQEMSMIRPSKQPATGNDDSDNEVSFNLSASPTIYPETKHATHLFFKG